MKISSRKIGTNEMPILQSQLFEKEAGIDHFCSMRSYENPGLGIWMPRQVHGTEIVVVDEHTPYDATVELQPVDADAVITRQPERWIGVRTADCVPVLLYDPKNRVIAAVHAGWRGTVKHITRLTVERMCASTGAVASNIMAMIGPSIGPDAFEVGEEVAQSFVDVGRGDCVVRRHYSSIGLISYPKPHVDLWQSNAMDLLEAGVELDQIDCTPWCTTEHPNELFSARKQGIDTGRIVTAIMLKYI